MKAIYQIFYSLLSLLLISCSHGSDTVVSFEAGTQTIIRSKLEFYSEGGKANLFFTTNKEVTPVISIEYPIMHEGEWLSAEGFVDDGVGEVLIYCDKNIAFDGREASIYVAVGDADFTIKVYQRPSGTVNTERDSYVLGAGGQTKEIDFTSNGKLTFDLRLDRPSWITYGTTGQDGKVKLQLSIEPNDGWGRVAFIDVYVDGKKHSTISLRQQPAVFSQDVVMPDVKAGSLYVLLGDDQTNLRNIRSLTIAGSLNALDLYVLKQRLFLSGLIAQAYLLRLDLYEARIVRGIESPYPDLEIELTERPPYVEEAVLPSDIFSNVSNIVSLDLPAYLEEIAPHCFLYCRELERIDVPDDVSRIGGSAFRGCLKLEEIVISPFSRLTSLGDYAFATGTRLESLYLPASLTDVSEYAFRSCHVDSLRLDWEVPPVWETVPKGKVLSVPTGTKSAYESATGWSDFEQIVEHDL